MRNLRLKEPVVKEQENSVVVHIRHERLASAEDIIMEYLDNAVDGMITNRVARGLTDWHQVREFNEKCALATSESRFDKAGVWQVRLRISVGEIEKGRWKAEELCQMTHRKFRSRAPAL